MKIKSITSARKEFYTLAQSIIDSHEPITLTGKHGNVVMLSEEDFNAIQETLYLYSTPNLVNDIQEGRQAPDSDFSTREDLFE